MRDPLIMIERFLINLKNQKEVKYESVESFFKLTNKELKLVQEGNEVHLNTYLDQFMTEILMLTSRK